MKRIFKITISLLFLVILIGIGYLWKTGEICNIYVDYTTSKAYWGEYNDLDEYQKDIESGRRILTPRYCSENEFETYLEAAVERTVERNNAIRNHTSIH